MTSTVAEPQVRMGRGEELKAMYEQINAKHMFPFWAKRSDVEHDEIKQLMEGVRAVPFHWSYKRDLEPLIHQSARLINHADSDRRSLVLVNPGLKPKRATVTTLYTAYRLNDANEVMPPHRHTASAIRLGLTGQQNFTGVEGEDIVFGHGDMVLIDQGQTAVVAYGVYAVGLEDTVLVKRVEKRPGQLVLLSDNRDYAPIVLAGDELDALRVIGRVLWVGREL